MFSPPHTRGGGNTLSRYLYQHHNTSPLPEIPDDSQFEANPDNTNFHSNFSPPLSPDEPQFQPMPDPQNFAQQSTRYRHVSADFHSHNAPQPGNMEEIRHLMRTIDLANSPNQMPQVQQRRMRTQSESAILEHNAAVQHEQFMNARRLVQQNAMMSQQQQLQVKFIDQNIIKTDN